MKKVHFILLIITTFVAFGLSSCAVNEGSSTYQGFDKKQDVNFNVVVTRNGKVLTRGEMDYGASESEATIDRRTPFGLIGIDAGTSRIIVDNEQVFDNSGTRSVSFDTRNWYGAEDILFSAYYPHVSDITYLNGNMAYMIPYSPKETEAGPLVSQTVRRSVSYLDVIPLVFRHITNDVGFKICDITYDEQLRGHIRLKQLIAHNVATEGYFIDSIGTNGGKWVQKTLCDEIEVFNGNAKVGIGSENELYVGTGNLYSERQNCSRFYSIPDEIRMGKQYVEVIFDVDSFDYNGETFPELKDQVQKFPIYGVLPGNSFIYGKQYTFHLGLDLGSLYKTIEFTATVADWNSSSTAMNVLWGENRIYEDNDYF